MGVKNLWDILDSCKKTLPLHYLQNKRVCIDLSCWVVQLQNVSKSNFCFKHKGYLQGLFHRVRALIALNCSLIFVTDGSIPSIKLSTYRRRLNCGSEVTSNKTKLQTVSSLPRNMGSEFSCMIKEAKVLGMALGIPCLDGIEEAEAQCALLNLESLCDGCFSSDSDIFLFGARTVYRDICLGDGGYVVCYEMEDIQRELGFGRNSLIALALFLGSDYSRGVHGLGPESACQIIKSIGDNIVLQRIASEGLTTLKKTKDGKKQVQISKCNNNGSILDHEMKLDCGGQKSFKKDEQFSQVISAYLKPGCHQADSDAVYRALAQHPFQPTRLRQICAQLFDWPPEKTDEYILPKIAERDLRRFANLRKTSIEAGVNLPLDEIPVKCPISSIIKPRKVQGRDCYEVSWEGMYGLVASTVPADLLESAYPEKIVEFKENKARENQNRYKRRHKKMGCVSVSELDLKLQDLILDTEVGSDGTRNVTQPSELELGKSTMSRGGELENQGFHDSEPKRRSNHGSAVSYHRAGLNNKGKDEVIDLLSHSPKKPSTSKCLQSSVQHSEVIQLSDSETDVSPEHERKARELRLFLASIRIDIH